MVAEQSLVADFARTRGRDAAFGQYTFASSAGQAVGPASKPSWKAEMRSK